MPKEPTLIPTDEQGNPVELNEEQKLMNLTKKDLIDMIEKSELKHKKLLTRSQNLKEDLDGALDQIKELHEDLDKLTEQQEQTIEEAAAMSETIRIKNRVLDEVVGAYLALANVTRTTADQGLKILEYNGLVSAPGQRR